MPKLKKGYKTILKEKDGEYVNAEVVEEFTVKMTIPKGTKAVIVKTDKGYFVCNQNN